MQVAQLNGQSAIVFLWKFIYHPVVVGSVHDHKAAEATTGVMAAAPALSEPQI
jgi:hypothetical protein